MIDKKYVKINLNSGRNFWKNILLSNNAVKISFVPFYCSTGKKILEIPSVGIVLLFWFICLFGIKLHTVTQAGLELTV